MYSLEEINQSLENEKLSNALYKMERFANSQGMTEIEKWCLRELNGWEDVDSGEEREPIVKYRYVLADWVNNFGQNMTHWAKPQSFFLRPPIWMGVEDMEGYIPEHLTLINDKLSETARHTYKTDLKANVSLEQINSLFERIRNQARRKLHGASSRVPNRRSSYPAPNFVKLVSDAGLVRVLSNRWIEANLAFEAGAYLATVILLGSVLEGVLLDKVEQNPAQANNTPKCPKDKSGRPLAFKDWKLQNLIEVCHDCGWLKKEYKDFSHVVRDYRNFIHPNKERQEGITFNEPICKVIWEVVSASLS